VAFGLWASGVVWLLAHYFWIGQGDFGPEISPAEPWALNVHGAFAMLALWFTGLLWGVHVLRGWKMKRGRWSGGIMLAALLLLGVTGYLLYYLGDEVWRAGASLIHWLVGLALLPIFFWHRFGRKSVRTLHGNRL
jgi:hypothetical protein